MSLNDLLSLAFANPWLLLILMILGAALQQILKPYLVLVVYTIIISYAFLVAQTIDDGGAYFSVFMLGVITAFAEIIGKFRDEPLKAFRTPHAVAYHTLNGLISVFALYLLRISDVAFSSPLEIVQAVVLAGLGSMLLMRSRLFTMKVGGDDMAFGPEQLIKTYFSFMERAIDRVRAQSRAEFVIYTMNNLKFDSIYDYTLTMLDSAQTLSIEARTKIEDKLGKIKQEEPNSQQLKSYKLGFLILTEMGEDFLQSLYHADRPDWWIKAPRPETQHRERPWSDFITIKRSDKSSEVSLFAYGSSLDVDSFLEKIGWEVNEKNKKLMQKSAQRARLPGHRLEFNKPSSNQGAATGLPNIVEDKDSEVLGVLYSLPNGVFSYFSAHLGNGYVEADVTVEVRDSEKVPAKTFLATATDENLHPTEDTIQSMMDGATELGIDEQYIQALGSKLSNRKGVNNDVEHRGGRRNNPSISEDKAIVEMESD